MRGITLVETLIYTALVGIVLTGFIALAMSASGLWTKQTIFGSVNSNIEQIQMILAQQIKTSARVIHPLAGTASTSLALEMSNGQELIFELKDSRLSARLDNEQEYNISDAGIGISNFSVTNVGTVGVDDSLRISASLAHLASSSLEFSFSAPLLIVITKSDEQY
ncbi:hypothetical protein KAJ89_02290 [Candidatus Parcubacteria bacterium]|nr:hypothetical protein [Candidatus Parcubacteria bacterium]